MSSGILVVSAASAILPGASDPSPASIEINLKTGKIERVHTRKVAKSDYTHLEDASFIELGEGQILLPGLVDAVSLIAVWQ